MLNIPKIIHQIWFQGENNIPTKYKEMYSSCLNLNKNYTRIVWDSVKIYNLINNDYSEYIDLYNNFPLMIQKIDFAKYVILYHYGGVYIDMDVMCIKNIDGLLNMFPKASFICSDTAHTKIETSILNKVASLFTSYKIQDKTCLNNGIILSTAKNDILKQLLNDIKKYFYIDNNYYTRDMYIFITTGPIIYTKSILEYKELHYDESIYIIDHKYMEPCVDIKKCDLKHAYFDHIYQNTWSTPIAKTISFIIKNIYLIEQYISIIILLIILCIIFILWNSFISRKKIDKSILN